MLVAILAGMALVACAVYVAQRMRLRESFSLDWRGTAIQGSAETINADMYRLRYTSAAGITAQTIKGRLPLYQRFASDGKSVTIMYDPLNPTNLQAKGQSYVATLIVGALFAAGMACVLYARRAAIRAKQAAASPLPADNGERRRRKGTRS